MRLIRKFVTMPDIRTGDNMQKFYKLAGICKVDSGFQIHLDGRMITTPEHQPFIVPTEALGLNIALEWQSQGKFILKQKMLLMNLAANAIDLSHMQLKDVIVNRLINLLENDNVCYREDEDDHRERQDQIMNPIIDFMKSKYGVELPKCPGISLPVIEKTSLDKFRELCEEKDDFYMVALETVATVTKSPSIAIALLDGFLTIEQAVKCSRFEENLQIEEFGKIEGTHDVEESYELMILSAAKNIINLKSLQT